MARRKSSTDDSPQNEKLSASAKKKLIKELEQELQRLMLEQQTQELKTATKRAENKARRSMHDLHPRYPVLIHYDNNNPNGPKTKIRYSDNYVHHVIQLDSDTRTGTCMCHHKTQLMKNLVYAQASPFSPAGLWCKDVAKARGWVELVVPKPHSRKGRKS